MSVGRDGITLGMQPGDSFEVATAATVSIYDRRGNRVGTVYLAQPPELGQQTMTDQLTSLIKTILAEWDGPIPELSYVTDAGDHETAYYRDVLRPMCHPRTGHRLIWQRVVDYYHASQRITTLAESLFGLTRAAESWARRMRKLLLKPHGPSRVLHAAAARASRHGVIAHCKKDYLRAYEYLRTRTKFMQYSEYRRRHLPIGSGVTEAACKTVFTQRLKLSGMRWKHEGARIVLTLRVILLSDIWQEVYSMVLNSVSAAPWCSTQCLPRQSRLTARRLSTDARSPVNARTTETTPARICELDEVQDQDLLARIERGEMGPLSAGGRTFLLAIHGKAEEAIALSGKFTDSCGWLDAAMCGIDLRNMCGQKEAAKDMARQIMERFRELPLDPWNAWERDHLLPYKAGDTDDESLLRDANASEYPRRWLTYSHWAIAMKHLADGDLPKARDCLRSCMEQRVIYMGLYSWSRALLHRLQTANSWPPGKEPAAPVPSLRRA